MNTKTLTQVVLPIAILAGLVFGITVVMNYSGPTGSKSGDVKLAVNHDIIKFNMTVASNEVPNWRSQYEVGEKGHFDFWFRNPNEQEVRVGYKSSNCACTGADLWIIPPDVWSEYLTSSAIAGMPGMPASALIAVANLERLKSRIEWQSLYDKGKKPDARLPAASSKDNPNFGILRLTWERNDPGPFTVQGDFVAQVAGRAASEIHLEANISVVSPFDLYSSVSGGRQIQLGEMGPFSNVRRELTIWSSTRSSLDLELSAIDHEHFKECVTWTKPVELTAAERAAFVDQMPKGKFPQGILSAYRLQLNVQERAEREVNGSKSVKLLDVGPFEFFLKLKSHDGAILMAPVIGVVRGDIRILGSQTGETIDFGQSFPSSSPRSVQVELVSERDDLELETKPESSPEFLHATLTLQKATGAAKQWILRVTIPADTLSGTLQNGHVVLKTKDATPRRIRTPVKATTFTSNR
ncbi:MAG: hypothetical protein K8T89_19300 [Planctomycetes bacterium]|nr:hypothetical protein [Planctomycetota bacterium]